VIHFSCYINQPYPQEVFFAWCDAIDEWILHACTHTCFLIWTNYIWRYYYSAKTVFRQTSVQLPDSNYRKNVISIWQECLKKCFCISNLLKAIILDTAFRKNNKTQKKWLAISRFKRSSLRQSQIGHAAQ